MPDTLSNNKSRKYYQSSSFIMALTFATLGAFVLLTLGYILNFLSSKHLAATAQKILYAQTQYVDALNELPTSALGEKQIYIVLAEDGKLPQEIYGSAQKLDQNLILFKHKQSYKVYVASIHKMKDARNILIGVDVTELARELNFMSNTGIISIIFIMMIMGIAYFISVFVVKGTNNIAEAAHEIMKTGDLSRRVEVSSRWDDLSNVAAVLNTMFNRIEELLSGVKQVSENIAHDLRTPLTRMRSHIEMHQLEDPDNKAYDSLLEEADHILKTFNALMRISRIEAEKEKSRFEDIDLDEVLHDVITFYEPLAEEKDIHLSFNLEEARVYGDRHLLFQAFANIVDNAVKFTKKGGAIEIKAFKKAQELRIEIANTGSGVDPNKLKDIFRRFYRTDESRNTEGSGLGLSLVECVVKLHDGKVSAENTSSGFKIIMSLSYQDAE